MQLSRPLTHLTKKRIEFIWTEECNKNFEKLKKAIISPQILKYPNFNKPFKLTVDASKYACGGVLSQEIDGFDHPITFISKTFKNGELNKSTIEKELLAIHYGITTLRPYLYGTKFLILTDHKPLIYLYNLKNPASKLTRIRLELEEYDFDIQHIRGKDNVIADALSRISFEDIKQTTNNNNTIFVTTRSMTKKQNQMKSIQKKQEKEKELTKTKVTEELTATFDIKKPRIKTKSIVINEREEKIISIEVSAFMRHKQIFKVKLQNEILTLKSLLSKIDYEAKTLNIFNLQWPINDDIFKIYSVNELKDIGEKTLKYVTISIIPTPEKINDDEKKFMLLQKFHNDKFYGGHVGQKKLYAKIRERYYWKNMSRDIANFVKSCKTCQTSKVRYQTKQPMVLTKTPIKAFDCVLIDTVGKLPKTIYGNEYAITIICELTKYLVIIPTTNKSAKEVAKAIVKNFILIYGPMKEIRTDLGTEFKNELMEEICKILEIERNFSTAYHHETLGTIERSHRTLNEFIRAYIDQKTEEWDIYSEYFQFCYNITKHESNGNKYSPFELVFGKQATLAYDVLSGQIDPIYNIDSYAKELKYRLQTAHHMTVEIINKMKQRNKKYYDRDTNPLDIKMGDLVFIEKEPYNKHKKIRNGPFKVLEIDEPNATIRMENKKYLVHKNRSTKLIS